MVPVLEDSKKVTEWTNRPNNGLKQPSHLLTLVNIALQNTGSALSYIRDERTNMQRATLGKSGSEAAS